MQSEALGRAVPAAHGQIDRIHVALVEYRRHAAGPGALVRPHELPEGFALELSGAVAQNAFPCRSQQLERAVEGRFSQQELRPCVGLAVARADGERQVGGSLHIAALLSDALRSTSLSCLSPIGLTTRSSKSSHSSRSASARAAAVIATTNTRLETERLRISRAISSPPVCGISKS